MSRIVTSSAIKINVLTYWSRVSDWNDDHSRNFCNKLQMIFDEGNKVNTTDDKMSVDGINDIWTYRVDTNFIVKSLGDSFHDMFDQARSKLDRNINTFQEILLARFAGSFRADDVDSNVDLLYKLLQIYKECRQKIVFFDKDGNPKNVDGNEIAKVIFHTPLRNYQPGSSDNLEEQFQFEGDIIEFNPDFNYQHTIIANILLHYFNKNDNKIEIFLKDIASNNINKNLHNFIYQSHINGYNEIITFLTSLYEAESIIPQLFTLVGGYLSDFTQSMGFIDFLKEKATITRNINGNFLQTLPSVNSCFSYIFTRGKGNYPHTCNIKELHQSNNFNCINDTNTSLLTGGGNIVTVADFDKRSTFITNVATNQNRVTLSKTASCELDEAPDSFSKTILELNRNTNTNTETSSLFETEKDNILFKTIDGKKLYSYKVESNINTNINDLINDFLNISNEITYNNIDKFDSFVEKLINLNKKYKELYDNKDLYPKITVRIPEFLFDESNKNQNKNKIIKLIKSSNNLKNYIEIICKVIKDEFSTCELEITLHNTPFTFLNKTNKITINKISVNNMSGQIKEFLELNTRLLQVQGYKKEVQYIQNLLEIDARLRGKASGDILPTLSTLPIVQNINNPQSIYQNKITSTIVTSGDENAILNLLLLAKLNPDIFDKVLILTTNTVDGSENAVAVRIGDNSDIFNEYDHGRLDSLLTYTSLNYILNSNVELLNDEQTERTFIQWVNDSFLGYFTNKNTSQNKNKGNVPTIITETPISPDVIKSESFRSFLDSIISDKSDSYNVARELNIVGINTMESLIGNKDKLPDTIDEEFKKKILTKLENLDSNQKQTIERKSTSSEELPVTTQGRKVSIESPVKDRSRSREKVGTSSEEPPVTTQGRKVSIESPVKDRSRSREKVGTSDRVGGRKSHKPKFTRRKNKNSSKRKTIKKRKMPKRKNKTRRNK
jgi:hypothetical protein